MHSFSPFRFDLAKQMPFAVSETSQSHAHYASATLRKTCALLENFLVAFCGVSGRACTPNLRSVSGQSPLAKRPIFDHQFGPAIALLRLTTLLISNLACRSSPALWVA
jgi:hypothetical protein